MNRYVIRFRYADAMSGWKWQEQEGSFCGRTQGEALRECKKVYGLGIDCEYEILEITKI